MCQDIVVSPRNRVNTALDHKLPDRTPVDFLAVPEIWESLLNLYNIPPAKLTPSSMFDPSWEQLLQKLEIDCRVISYDQFCSPPPSALHPKGLIDWFSSPGRSTPNRMWRQITPDNLLCDIWGRQFKLANHPYGTYEELSKYPLEAATTLTDVKDHPWPEPDWWDFSLVSNLLDQMDKNDTYHIRYRIGSVFEVAWQLAGMEKFFIDLIIDPKLPNYIMERLTDIYVELTEQFLAAGRGRIDMVYFYDDLASQESLLISKDMWKKNIRPHHARLIEVAKSHDLKVMYHCDGAIHPLIPDLIDLGVDVLNPIQLDAKGMDPLKLKDQFGNRLCFHGGIDIIETLPRGSVSDVQREAKTRIRELGKDGGYVMAGTHHVQADTPLENIQALYDLDLRKTSE